MQPEISFTPLPPREALEYFRGKGFAPPGSRFDWRDVWRSEHARQFVVAKAMQDDILQLIREDLDRAIAEGRTLDQFRDDLKPKLQRAGWWGQGIQTDPETGETQEVRLGTNHRLRVIYDTNLRTSLAAGRWARIQRTKAAFPYLQYRQIQRETKREEHARYHMIVLPVDHPAWERIFPPNGWFCGCSVRQLTRGQLEREGLSVTTDFELEASPFINPRTGEVSDLPEGVHPGFDSNPGMSWLEIGQAHEQTSLGLTDQWRAADRALVEDARARGLRDGAESLALYDLSLDPDIGLIDWTRGEKRSVFFSAPMTEALERPGARLVAIHNHPSSSSLSPQDHATLLAEAQMHQVVAVGHDGSMYRIERRTSNVVPADATIGASDDVRDLLMDAVLAGEVSTVDAGTIHSHIYSLVLQGLGATRYQFALSTRMTQITDRNRSVIDRIVAELTEA